MVNFLNYENMITHLQETWKIQNKITYSSTILKKVKVLVAQSCLTLCDPMDCCTPGLPVPHHLPDFAQVPVH